MIKLVEGGHWEKKGYWYELYATLPTFKNSTCTSITGGIQRTKRFEFPTDFMLTSNKIYCNIRIRVLGFGIGLEIHSRS